MARKPVPNMTVTTVSLNGVDLKLLRSKLALKGMDFSEWLRIKIKEELQSY